MENIRCIRHERYKPWDALEYTGYDALKVSVARGTLEHLGYIASEAREHEEQKTREAREHVRHEDK